MGKKSVKENKNIWEEFSEKERFIEIVSKDNKSFSIYANNAKFASNIKSIAEQIIGQEDAINEISKSIWYLTTVERKKPYVIQPRVD